ncbi:MAG: outer membrane beta-barrel protein [Bacteroidota bacterium]|nr:outer membrane beta-barrel protein [Bacteroidota bacterium]
MKSIINYIQRSRKARISAGRTFKHVVLGSLILVGMTTYLQAQEVEYTKPSWWFGVAGGANFNFYRGSTQNLNQDLTMPVAFHNGNDVGVYLAPLIEFQHPSSIWGFGLQAGYDSRRGSFDREFSPCNCPTDLSTNLSYVTVEPSIRLAPFNSNFYLFGGPRFAFNTEKSFTYKVGINPDFPDQLPTPDVKGDLSNINKTIVSMQIGAGYDIPLTTGNSMTQFVLSPFVSYHPYFGQDPRSIETWSVSTLRAGAAIKFGMGRKVSMPAEVMVPDANFQFYVNAPKNIPTDRKVREIFPLRNYVFFNSGSTEIPNRYELLKKSQVKDFKEDQVEFFTPRNFSGRSERQMIVYYNVLNILGDRLGKDPSANIKLVGSSEKGQNDGMAMAESIKTYLVDIFGINASRIATAGRDKPLIPSEQAGATQDLDLLRDGDRRVSIESVSPTMLMEFQTGPTAPLKPVEFMSIQQSPYDSYVTFNVDGGKEAFSSWSLELKDEVGKIQNYGPYTQDKVSLQGKSILGTRPQGNFKATMIGKTWNGKTVTKETPVHIELWAPANMTEGTRYSVLFEFDESKAITLYKQYLTDIVTPKIPIGGTVHIHGHTDKIGDELHNTNLSKARANEVMKIIETALTKAGRNDVNFEVYGLGEDENWSPFENKYPEERFYNRTVIIDIIPK